MTLVSIVIPLYNEEENVEDLYRELKSVLRSGSKYSYEFVLVDDGSSDRTVERLRQIAGNDPEIVIVEFRRNFGQTAAMAAGFDFARGEIVATLDGDLQNDPAEIPQMLEKLEEGYDLVAGWRKNRQDAMLSRKIPSMLANKLISKITKVKLHDYGCTLKVMRAEIAKNINMYGEMHRFIPALAAELGVKIAEVPVNHRARTKGVSKYGISRTFRVILDLMTVKFFLGFRTKPLHMFGALGLGSGLLGSVLLAELIFQRLFMSMPLGNRPLLILAIFLVLVGLQFLCFGLLAEILVRTYHESQNKKIYTVKEVFRGTDSNTPTPTEEVRKIAVLR
jgi:glycosyltransferase involved in cell wall biosynthesis